MDREHIERISRALGDQTRLMIYQEIASRDQMNCSDIASLRGVTQATVSHHLKTLNEAGLIECRRKGQFIYNRAVPKTMQNYIRALSRMVRKSGSKTR